MILKITKNISKHNNMSNIKNKAEEYLEAGLSILPTTADKIPALYSWEDLQNKILSKTELNTLFTGGVIRPEIEREVIKKDKTKFIAKGIKCFIDPLGIGIITGAISGNLEVIDVDTKHDDTGHLWNDLKTLLEDNLPDLYNSLVIAKTKNGGYHIYYRCNSIAGNLKLSTKLNREILVETRGEGGYVIAPPTLGYSYIQGEPINIPTITPEQRDIILSISRSFNELEEIKPKTITTSATTYSSLGLSPFDDYNNRGDVVGLLESKGWKVTSQRGERINLLRPGSTDSKTSGNYHTGLKVLRVFSSSTEFNPDKAYSPAMVFSLLECNEDSKLTYKKLLELGYGEPYNGEVLKHKELKTEKIKVEAVNSVNRVTSVISTPGDNLEIENIYTNIGDIIIITPLEDQAQEEILKAIDLLKKTNKDIYINELGTETRDYKYKLNFLFQKYGNIQENEGGLTDRQIDLFLVEVIEIAAELDPLNKDIFLNYFLELGPIKELGITKESLNITIDKLTSTRDREAQAIAFKDLLSEVTKLQAKGKIDKALDLLDISVKEVKLQDKATEFSKLLLPTSEAIVKEQEANLPESLNSGFKIGYEELRLPGQAITVYAAPTNHGKTDMLINTVLNVAQRYPDKKFIFFTYEERSNSILQYFLNTFINTKLNKSTYGSSNRRIIKDYFKTGSTEFISTDKLEIFEEKKEEFFKTYIETGRILIKGVDYNSEELNLAIRYLQKNDPTIGGVFIDYFQLLNLPANVKKIERINSRQEEMKKICQELNLVAKNTGLPLILAAQFNRDVTDLTKLHPTKLGEAGDIERIVNTLIGLWNLEKSIVGPEPKDIEEKTGGHRSGMYVELLKSRELQTGISTVIGYNGRTGKISNDDFDFEDDDFEDDEEDKF